MSNFLVLNKIIKNGKWIGCTVKDENTHEVFKMGVQDVISLYKQGKLKNAVIVNNTYIRTKPGYTKIKEYIVKEKFIYLYHASTVEVRNPQFNYNIQQGINEEEISSDFGVGFYLSTDIQQPIKLVCHKGKVVINKYKIDLTDLNIKEFDLNEEWLLSVVFHRRNFKKQRYLHSLRDYYRKNLLQYDIVIGPIADDRMFSTIQNFIESTITDVVTMKSMDIMGYTKQYTFKTQKACNKLIFVNSKTLSVEEVNRYIDIVNKERESIEDKLLNIRTKYFREGKLFAELLKERGIENDREKNNR